MLVPFFSPFLYDDTHKESPKGELTPYDSMFDDFFRTPVIAHPMKCDVKETDDAYEVKADIPGVDKNDITVTFDDGVLNIAYKHDDSKDEKDEDGKYVMQERSYSAMSRSFDLPDGNKDDIHAKYADGVLTVTVAKDKTEHDDSAKVTIE